MLAFIIAIALAAQASAAAGPPTPATETSAPSLSPVPLHRAAQFDMISKITGRSYRIFVSKPYDPPPPGGYPVLYVVDGDFDFATALAQAGLAPLDHRSEVVVVGIGYPNGSAIVRRNADLAPSMPSGATLAEMEKTAGPVKPGTYGDAEGFHRFMTEELRPIIANVYKVDPKSQSLMGYSLGGLFALHVLFRHPESYQRYVISSPSIWWNDREVLKDEAAFDALVKAGKVAPCVLITSNEWEQFEGSPSLPASGPERIAELTDMRESRMVDNARELATRLTALKGGVGYKVHYTLFPEETHLSGVPAAISRGVTFVTVP